MSPTLICPLVECDSAESHRAAVGRTSNSRELAAPLVWEALTKSFRWSGFTALHRDEADLERNKALGWQEGTEIALDQFVARVKSMK